MSTPQKIAVVDPGSGNLASVLRALDRAAADNGLQIEASITRDAAEVLATDRIVLPGQGAMPDCMRELDATWGRAVRRTRTVETTRRTRSDSPSR